MSRLSHLSLRFSKPVYQPDTLRTVLWPVENGYAFECRTLSRLERVLSGGSMRLTAD